MAGPSLQRAIWEKYSLPEDLMAEARFIKLNIETQAATELVSIGISRNSFIIGQIVVSGREPGFELKAIAPLSLLTVICFEQTKRLKVYCEVKLLEPTSEYELCSCVNQKEVWQAFVAGVKHVRYLQNGYSLESDVRHKYLRNDSELCSSSVCILSSVNRGTTTATGDPEYDRGTRTATGDPEYDRGNRSATADLEYDAQVEQLSAPTSRMSSPVPSSSASSINVSTSCHSTDVEAGDELSISTVCSIGQQDDTPVDSDDQGKQSSDTEATAEPQSFPISECPSMTSPKLEHTALPSPTLECSGRTSPKSENSAMLSPNPECPRMPSPKPECPRMPSPKPECPRLASLNPECPRLASPKPECSPTASPIPECSPMTSPTQEYRKLSSPKPEYPIITITTSPKPEHRDIPEQTEISSLKPEQSEIPSPKLENPIITILKSPKSVRTKKSSPKSVRIELPTPKPERLEMPSQKPEHIELPSPKPERLEMPSPKPEHIEMPSPEPEHKEMPSPEQEHKEMPSPKMSSPTQVHPEMSSSSSEMSFTKPERPAMRSPEPERQASPCSVEESMSATSITSEESRMFNNIKLILSQGSTKPKKKASLFKRLRRFFSCIPKKS